MPKIMGSSLAEHRERTRTALFDALAELMAKHSFDKITLSDVAAHAGVGRTAVYNHFADKEDLLLAFMEHETARYAEELSASLAGVEDPIDRLRVYVRQQALLKRHFHFPATGPLANSVSRGTAGRLRAHAGLMAQMLAQILTDAVATEAIPPQDPGSGHSRSCTPASWAGARRRRSRPPAPPTSRPWTPSCCARWARTSRSTASRRCRPLTPPRMRTTMRMPIRLIRLIRLIPVHLLHLQNRSSAPPQAD